VLLNWTLSKFLILPDRPIVFFYSPGKVVGAVVFGDKIEMWFIFRVED